MSYTIKRNSHGFFFFAIKLHEITVWNVAKILPSTKIKIIMKIHQDNSFS